MIDQGWMIDDGTCDLCVRGQCWQCTKPQSFWLEDDPDYVGLMCCCNEGYDLGRAPAGAP